MIGAGGDRDRGKRPLMGAAAAEGADVVMVTDDNPRTEDPAAIRAEVLAGRVRGRTPPPRIVEVAGRRAAIDEAVRLAEPGDVVALLGKGHERGQEIAGEVLPFDDRVELAAALRARFGDLAGRPVIPLTLAEVAAAVDGRLVAADPDARVTGPVEFDSRKVSPGGLFVAFPGEKVDGHDFAAARGRRRRGGGARHPGGARACRWCWSTTPLAAMGRLARAVVDRLPGLTVIGLTGSSGKTTTKDLIAQLAARLGPTVAPPGSFNNELGHPYTALQADPETRFLVLEMGARGVGHVRYLCDVAPPRIGVVLNVGVAHIGEFGSVETIALAKGELVEALPADGLAVLNADDPLVDAMAARTRARVVRYGEAATPTCGPWT